MAGIGSKEDNRREEVRTRGGKEEDQDKEREQEELTCSRCTWWRRANGSERAKSQIPTELALANWNESCRSANEWRCKHVRTSESPRPQGMQHRVGFLDQKLRRTRRKYGLDLIDRSEYRMRGHVPGAQTFCDAADADRIYPEETGSCSNRLSTCLSTSLTK
eukprot:761042-Hanusia_phi.AAC.5